jgi:hypothetical protein
MMKCKGFGSGHGHILRYYLSIHLRKTMKNPPWAKTIQITVHYSLNAVRLFELPTSHRISHVEESDTPPVGWPAEIWTPWHQQTYSLKKFTMKLNRLRQMLDMRSTVPCWFMSPAHKVSIHTFTFWETEQCPFKYFPPVFQFWITQFQFIHYSLKWFQLEFYGSSRSWF